MIWEFGRQQTKSPGRKPNNVLHETCSRRARNPLVMLLTYLANTAVAAGEPNCACAKNSVMVGI